MSEEIKIMTCDRYRRLFGNGAFALDYKDYESAESGATDT